jgi:hypothetical protein
VVNSSDAATKLNRQSIRLPNALQGTVLLPVLASGVAFQFEMQRAHAEHLLA